MGDEVRRSTAEDGMELLLRVQDFVRSRKDGPDVCRWRGANPHCPVCRGRSFPSKFTVAEFEQVIGGPAKCGHCGDRLVDEPL